MSTEANRPANIQVRVVTTAGSYPEHGHEKVSTDEAIQSILTRATVELKIVDASEWVARINDVEINPATTYASHSFHGEVKIDFGRREGGGGNASAVV